MAIPFVLFPVAQQSIDSSLAGMLNAPRRCSPQQSPRSSCAAVSRACSWPAWGSASWEWWPSPCRPPRGAHATAGAAGLVLLATLLYGIAINLAVPLQRRHGALPVLLRAQLVAAALLGPVGAASVPGSSLAWSSILAVAALGAFGTGSPSWPSRRWPGA